MNPVSLNMVVRNESKRLSVLLPLVKPYFNEIVIIDQQSTDNTVEVAKQFTDKVFTDIPTGYSESSRQLAISKSSNEWIFVLDADEFITDRFLDDIPSLIVEGKSYGGVFCCQAFLRSDIEISIQEIQKIGWYIDREHISMPFRWRLFRRDCIAINNKLHGGIGPRHLDIGLILNYNGIVEWKNSREQEIDLIRYEAIANNTYSPEKYL